MNIILLSGGSGKKLWPLSNDVRSKQFIKIFKNEKGRTESMIQRIYRQISSVDKNAVITVATSRPQASTVINQLGKKVKISVEPERKDTLPAIILALEYLKSIEKITEDDAIIVCPVDLFVENDFFDVFQKLEKIAKEKDGITLLGVPAESANVNYGYIIPETNKAYTKIKLFKEKPDSKEAENLISEGARWSAGVFAFRLGYMLEKAHQMIDYIDYDDLFNKYSELKPISFDKAILEKSDQLSAIMSQQEFRDLGTWDAIVKATQKNIIGNAVLSKSCEDVNVINDMDLPILGIGLKNVVISASQQGILVADQDESIDIQPYVDSINTDVMFAEKSWGSMTVLDVSNESMIIKLTIKAKKRMSYHSHEHRDEIWVVMKGHGRTIVDGMVQNVQGGDVITMQAGCRHTIIAETALSVIEIQRGKDISIADKKKYELE